MTRTAIAIRHVAFEDLGLLAPMLAERGYAVRYLEAGVDAIDAGVLDAADLVVVLGGPIGVYEVDRYPFLASERAAIAAHLAARKPTLGICLGAQLIAQALGAEVASTGKVEIGFGALTLTDEGRASVLKEIGTVPVLHWHGDQFAIPAGAQRLAQTPGFPNQAFAIDRHVLGLQFHLEVETTQLERWLIGHAHELAAHRIDPNSLRRDAAAHGSALTHAARGIFAAWLDGL
ncbi:glutamine amidotransferase [Dyella sp. LX-66]|uniref:glutamine amidotransferase n=1 Tax=unclassified Dyella TaxID=2634549 RepID=UPI001BDFC95C|nr:MULTISPECIES: glutamine amidotransferase [unclassified Dyella]MBT2119297.1 glutamine amidotransferase [Dyella sp. LX-1]MBT2141668.1 glutamine amidotransferase [Dyella sp. LX-66]